MILKPSLKDKYYAFRDIAGCAFWNAVDYILDKILK